MGVCIIFGLLSDIAEVIAPYQATGPEQLSLQPGQLIDVRKKNPSGWWEGELQVCSSSSSSSTSLACRINTQVAGERANYRSSYQSILFNYFNTTKTNFGQPI